MSLPFRLHPQIPEEVEERILAVERAAYEDGGDGSGKCSETRAALAAAIERAIADAVKPWRELVERANRLVDYGSSPGWQVDAWLADAKALLEKPCSTS